MASRLLIDLCTMHVEIEENITSIVLPQASVGRSPSGFLRIHAELPVNILGRFVGYDPRALKAGPGNVSAQLHDLQTRVQRSISSGRVKDLVEYLHQAEAGKFCDLAPIDLITASTPHINGSVSFPINSEFFVAEGQTRYCALLDFVRERPAAVWTQGVTISVLPEAQLVEWAGQLFHDRNYYAQPVRIGKALATDTRDPVNALTRELDEHPVILRGGGIAYERDTLAPGDERLTTHSVMHRFVRGFLGGRGAIDGKHTSQTSDISPTARKDLHEYVLALGLVIPWDAIGSYRDESLARSSAVFAALGVLGYDLFNSDLPRDQIGERLSHLSAVDWRKTNLSWVGVFGSEKNGRVQPSSARPAIDGLLRHLRTVVGLSTPS